MVNYKNVYINDYYTIAGELENNGNLKDVNRYIKDYYDQEKSIEDCQIKLNNEVLNNLIKDNIDLITYGELTNQLSLLSYSLSNRSIPSIGIYSACSTFIEGLIILSNMIDKKQIKKGINITSSHNLLSEKQFRYPIEYGGIKPNYSTFTSTGTIGCIVSNNISNIKIKSSKIGSIINMGIKDANNMGAVMAPSAVDTLIKYLNETKTNVNDYDLILTGDLGYLGTNIFKTLLKKNYNINIKNHIDAGSIIYKKNQNKYMGGSGPICLPLILFNNILKQNKYKKIIIIGTGSLHNTTIVNQKKEIPSIAHLIYMEVE